MRLFAYLVPALTVLLAACRDGDGAQRSEAAESPAASAPAAPPDLRVATADTARIKGAADAPVWIVEISDFQCPFCRDWQQRTFPQLDREYLATGRAKLAYVNLPLPNHRHALLAAEAAMCAGAQGRFWRLHDALFATQPRWSEVSDARPVFDSLAASVGVAMDRWEQCVDAHIMRPLIQRDYERSVASGANSTPTFLIMPDTSIRGAQPAMLVGAQPMENFRNAIDAILARRPTPSARD